MRHLLIKAIAGFASLGGLYGLFNYTDTPKTLLVKAHVAIFEEIDKPWGYPATFNLDACKGGYDPDFYDNL